MIEDLTESNNEMVEKEMVSSFYKLKYFEMKEREHDELQRNYQSSNSSSNSYRENKLKKVQRVNQARGPTRTNESINDKITRQANLERLREELEEVEQKWAFEYNKFRQQETVEKDDHLDEIQYIKD